MGFNRDLRVIFFERFYLDGLISLDDHHYRTTKVVEVSDQSPQQLLREAKEITLVGSDGIPKSFTILDKSNIDAHINSSDEFLKSLNEDGRIYT